MHREAGRWVSCSLSLEPAEVAAVAKQVALERVAALALLVVQLEPTVLWVGRRGLERARMADPTAPSCPVHLTRLPVLA